MPPKPTKHIEIRQGENVRIGPISLITLIVVICMAVLGVLAASTSHATSTISTRQAEASIQMYRNETAGQEFVASVDEALSTARTLSGSAEDGAWAVEQQLDTICENARATAPDHITCTANVDGTTVNAELACDNARKLDIAITIQDDATYRISAWKTSSVESEAQSNGTLWMGA